MAIIADATVALANHRGHGGALGALIQTRGQFVDGYFYVIGSKWLCDDSLDGGTLVVCWPYGGSYTLCYMLAHVAATKM